MNTVLIAEDEPEVRDYLGLALHCCGYKVEYAEDGEQAVRFLRSGQDISLLLLDLIMPKKDGLQTLSEVRREWPRLPVITVSGCCTPAHVASALKGGAVDFLSKPVGHEDLLRSIQAALKLEPAKRAPEPSLASESVKPIGAMGLWSQNMEPLLTLAGASDAPVLLRGETGVGKEVLARNLHARSKRADRPFLKINCAALPSELVESELFGYEKGAFTGALKTTPGKFELAERGTILLDEIGDMDFKLQAKLLQVLQDHEFLRLGAQKTSRVDVRIMAATHCDLENAIVRGRFREDLYYRLNILEFSLPPLRERKDEIAGLARVFLDKYAPGEQTEVPADLHSALLEHAWPGNVRELENTIRKFLVFRNADTIVNELRRKTRTVSSFAQPTPAPEIHLPTLPSVKKPADRPTLDEVNEERRQAEASAIVEALNSSLWNRKQAAKVLQIHYKALLYKMKKLGIGESPTQAPLQ